MLHPKRSQGRHAFTLYPETDRARPLELAADDESTALRWVSALQSIIESATTSAEPRQVCYRAVQLRAAQRDRADSAPTRR